MTDPYLPEHGGAAEPGGPAAARPSRWPKAIGVISLVYAIGGMTCALGYTSMAFLTDSLMALQGLDLAVPLSLKIIAGVLGLAVLAVGVVLIVGAVGVLHRRPGGVVWLKRWVILRLTLLLLGVLTTVLTSPAQLEIQRQVLEVQNKAFRENDMEDRVVEPDEGRMWRTMMIQSAAFTAVVAAYPVFLGLFLSSRKVSEEVEQWE